MIRQRFSSLTGRIAALLAGTAMVFSTAVPAPAIAASTPTQMAVFAGGCFWGMEEVFESLRGVKNVVAGYSGGSRATANYETVSTGTTGHAESIEVTYDPGEISYGRLLDVYFTVAEDPTELNRQGPDEGTQYRSEIFYADAAQRNAAKDYIAKLTVEKKFSAPIVTKVARLAGFYPAEAYHQHYARLHPDDPYIVEVDGPKMAALHERFPQLVASR